MGFCIFNQAAIAARYAQKKHGCERVAVVDFDVHHGNGTQDIFWRDKDLMYRLDPPDAALSRHRRAVARRGVTATSSMRRCAPGDGGDAVQGGLRDAHPAGAAHFGPIW